MTLETIISSIDSEIARLKQVCGLLSGSSTDGAPSTKRKLSPAARKKIAAAQRKRWAKQKAAK
jgi:hypothetical protein